MKKYDHFFGVDVSKKTVDITHSDKQEFTHRQFPNNDEGMSHLMTWFQALGIVLNDTLLHQ